MITTHHDTSAPRTHELVRTTAPQERGELRKLALLRACPDNPRVEVLETEPEIIQLAESIRRHGIIEPLVVTPNGMIIAGHRRAVAARLAGLIEVPVHIRDTNDGDALELAIHENMQRASLTPLEEARAFRLLIERKKMTIMDVARALSLVPATVSTRLAILKLSPEVQELFHRGGELPATVAPTLARLSSTERQLHLAMLVARKTLTAPRLKAIVAKEITAETNGRERGAKPPGESAARSRRPPDLKLGGTPLPTREEAMTSLRRNLSKNISVHTLNAIFEGVCGACGMIDNRDVCRACPLPRVISAVAGRCS